MAHKQKDLICKSTLEDHTEDMLRFFYPEAASFFDFSKGFEWLNIELADLNPGKEDMRDAKLADRVLKVFTFSGELVFIVIGVEFQGYHDPDFHKRMFAYYYRLLDKYGDRISLLAIYTERFADLSPSDFNTSLLNTRNDFSFVPYKVWQQNEADLMLSNNPYAFIILTIKLGEKSSIKRRLPGAILLANTVYNKPFSQKVKAKLLNFMKLYFDFEDDHQRSKFDTVINKLTNKFNKMGIMEIVKERLKEKSIKEGLKQGFEQGIESEQIRTVKKMLLLGFDPEIIHKITGLAIAEIKAMAF